MTHWKRSVRRYLWRIALAIALLVVLLSCLAPFINAAAFSGRIERALEESLGRTVSFGEAHFTLLTGPGFSLGNVIIQEDPRYGLEPFAQVPKLEARLRLSQLVRGHIAFSSLRLMRPSLNLVKRIDGLWNVAELVDRLSAPSRAPVNLFPAVQVSEGRIDFKSGMRKTMFYLTDADLSIYPERSGKLYIQFSGSPARTDRAGNGFGHLRGTANWYLKPASSDANELEADVTLDPSNLSELTTLFEGEDAGVHGTVGSHMRIEGPATALRLSGEVHLADVHRWDLLPESGEDWRIQCTGHIDLMTHRFDLQTLPSRPGTTSAVLFEMRVNDFLAHPAWSVLATFSKAPVANLLPLSRRMGLAIPEELKLEGTLDGVLGYSNTKSLSGGLTINGAVAKLPNLPPLRAAMMTARISADHVHFDPAAIDTRAGDTQRGKAQAVDMESGGGLQVGGDYDLSKHRSVVSLNTQNFPVTALKDTVSTWFSAPTAFSAISDGDISGQISYARQGTDSVTWSGQFSFDEATLLLPGFSIPLTHSQGRVQFDQSTLDLDRFTATLGKEPLSGSYHFNAQAKRPQRVHIDLPVADWNELEAALEPTLRAEGFLVRLGIAHRKIPAWLATRDLQGDVSVKDFSVNGSHLGSLQSRVMWLGPDIEFQSFSLRLAEGNIQAHGDLDVASNAPRYHLVGSVTDFPWRGGTLNAEGQFRTSGTGMDAWQRLEADGTFSGRDLNLSAQDQFEKVSGDFHFSFFEGWPSLRLAEVVASQEDEAWTGAAASQSDGKLVIDLENAGRQRRVISTLESESAAFSSADQHRVGLQ